MTNVITFVLLFVTTTFSAESADTAVAAKPHACSFFTYISAEKLLNGKVTGVDSEQATPDGGHRWKCTFTADSGNGRIFFDLSRSSTEAAAKSEFESVRLSNAKHGDLEDWPGIGDEALAARTDGRSFQFVMVRKGTRTIRIKLNPVNGSTLDDVKTVASLLVGKLK